MNMIKAKWARKLMQSRYFVVLTDRESGIYLEGVDPNSFDDIIGLQSQGAALSEFHSKMGELIKEHETAAKQLLKVKQPKRSKRATSSQNRTKGTSSRNTKVTKIRVTQK